jgi:hypothetical protein
MSRTISFACGSPGKPDRGPAKLDDPALSTFRFRAVTAPTLPGVRESFAHFLSPWGMPLEWLASREDEIHGGAGPVDVIPGQPRSVSSYP